ncbi:transglycosylase SLT domain-containing protein [Histidinibacterium aquaticum]|uniref:transglycosylase SLT domain-containing protein n=1 Tax=Histidinibacterium aquaticum TaxID=2613962 RepID=UPI001CC73032|nr:transglycosylase SLT domain-containing protein [Histidinibacterium aquaticum]
MRPLLRSDAARLAEEAMRAELRDVSPMTRPVWMVRYPPRVIEGAPPVRPPKRDYYFPETRWDHRSGGAEWTHATLAAIRAHGRGLEDRIPADIDSWCPAYRDNPPSMRRAFWVGMMSALAYHESRWRPTAVGGGGQWYGLLQVYPPTARHYGCAARTGDALKDPAANLSCSIRIMARQVPRYGTVSRGMRDWGPFHSASKRAQMAAWTREQEYCRPQLAVMASLRPQARPADPRPELSETLSTMGR